MNITINHDDMTIELEGQPLTDEAYNDCIEYFKEEIQERVDCGCEGCNKIQAINTLALGLFLSFHAIKQNNSKGTIQ